MRTILTGALFGALSLPCAVVSCGSSTTPTAAPDAGAFDAGVSDAEVPDTGVADAAPTDAAADAPSMAQALVRVAHLSPGTPAVDFCVAPHGTTTFTGPVLAGAGLPGGLAYSNVSQYLPLAPAQYDVRVVAAGAPNCSTSLAGLSDFTQLPALAAGQSVTIAALRRGNAVELAAYVDRTTAPANTTLQRFIHASPGTGAVDVGLGAGSNFTPLFRNIAFGESSGYVQSAPITNQVLSVRPRTASTDALSISGVNVPAGPVMTTFAIGVLQSVGTPLTALVCVDNAPPQNHLSACVLTGQAPGRANVRIAHLSPNAPAVDVCVKPTTQAAFPQQALLASLGVTTGIRYPQVTQYVSLPAGTYDIRVVAAGAPTCATAALPDIRGVVVPQMISATVAAIGLVNPPANLPGFTLKPFVDDQTFYSANAELRFIHASPGTPPVDVGLGTGSTFRALFTNVAFGQTGSGGSVSPNGYLTVPPFMNQTATARITGQTTDALSVPNVSLAANQVATAYAIGVVGSTASPPQLLLCLDNAPPQGALATCSAPAP